MRWHHGWALHLRLALAAASSVTLASLSACGGGGGSDAGPPAAASSGLAVYSYLQVQYGVDMATGRTTALVPANRDLYFSGIGIGPARETALAYNTDLIFPNSRLTVRAANGNLIYERSFGYGIRTAPKFSRNGAQIVYTGKTNDNPSTTFVQVRNSDGAAAYFFNDYDDADWLPDGRLVLRSLGARQLFISGAAIGSPVTPLPGTGGTSWFSVSPDGSKVAMARKINSDSPRHIYMMNIDGSGMRQVTTSNQEETRVVFSPDGKQLLVTSYGCGSTTGASVDEDLMHVISAEATAPIEIAQNVNSAPTRLVDEQGRGRCTSYTLVWR